MLLYYLLAILPLIQAFKVYRYISGVATLSRLISLPSEEESTLKGKNLLSLTFFSPFIVVYTINGDQCEGKQTGNDRLVTCSFYQEIIKDDKYNKLRPLAV